MLVLHIVLLIFFIFVARKKITFLDSHFCTQLLSQNAFGYVLPITSFVVAWLETWFLDFKVLPQEADDKRGEGRRAEKLNPDSTKMFFLYKTVFSL